MIEEIFGGRNFRWGKVWLRKIPVEEVSVGELPIGEVSVGGLLSGKCQSGNCPVKRLSYNRKILTMLWAVPLENMFS